MAAAPVEPGNQLLVNVWYDNAGNLEPQTSVNVWASSIEGGVKTATHSGGVFTLENVGGNTPFGLKVAMGASHPIYGQVMSEAVLNGSPIMTMDIVYTGVGQADFLSPDTLPGPGPTPTGDGPPANDDCSNAIPVALNSTTNGSTIGANNTGLPVCGTSNGAGDVWYSISGTGLPMTVTTCSATVQYDTKLTVYTDGCGTLTCVDGNDDDCTGGSSAFLSTVNWASTAGQEYLIMVHGFSTSTGNFEMTVSGEEPSDPEGACCFSDGSCEVLTEADCGDQGGDYQGDGTGCGSGVTTNYPGNGFAIAPVGISASDTLSVGDSGAVLDVNVNVANTHTWQGDLTMDLDHGATSVRVFDRPGVPATTFGCGSDNWNITLDDEGGGGPVETAPCVDNLTGSFVPANPLSAFDGDDRNGDWTLTVTDHAAGDSGSITAWSLDIEQDAGEPPCPPPECFLVLGGGEGSAPYVGNNHVFTTQLDDIEDSYFTLMEDLPEFQLPVSVIRQGNGLAGGAMSSGFDPNANVPEWMMDGEFSLQVLMWNPSVFPGLPEQYTAGLQVEILRNGRVLSQPFGTSLGDLTVWHEVFMQDGKRMIRFPFLVPGL